MKRILLLVLVFASVYLGYSFASDNLLDKDERSGSGEGKVKTPILRFALVADSHNENELLTKALNQARGAGVNFVIGLGDWTSVGTLEQLTSAKKVFDESGLIYYVVAGDHDLWDSRNRGDDVTANFKQVFSEGSQIFLRDGIHFVLLDNSDIYKGIDDDWQTLENALTGPVSRFPPASARPGEKSNGNAQYQVDLRAVGNPTTTATRSLTFVFAHRTPFHPQSAHIMGENNADVADQAKRLMSLFEQEKVEGFFSGDLHFFARFNSPSGAVKMTTIGAVASERNFQGPRFAIVTVYEDYSWEVEDVEIH